MALPAPLPPTPLLPRMDHQSLMIHRRKLVVSPINVSDWIFDIWANPFVRHLIKVLKGSVAIARHRCPQVWPKQGAVVPLGEMLPPSPSAPFPPFPFPSFTAPQVQHSLRAPEGGRDSLAKQERDCLPLAACLRGSGPQELA